MLKILMRVPFLFCCAFGLVCINTWKDPKTSRWLWDIRERSRQKKRTENYRSIIAMQQSASFSGQGEGGDGGVNIQVMEDMTRLTDKQQMANFLTWGKWDLDDSAIEKLVKDEERKERVSISDNSNILHSWRTFIIPYKHNSKLWSVD